MKILRIAFENIGVFSNGVSIDFVANDRVVNTGQVKNLFGTISSQNIVGIVGPNASGKTILLRLIRAAISIVVENRGLNDIKFSEGIIKEDSVMTVDFFNENKLFRVCSTIGVKSEIYKDSVYYFKQEVIYSKSKTKVKARANLFDFSDDNIISTRAEFMNEFNFLKPQDSIVAAYNKNSLYSVDTIDSTNLNIYYDRGKEFMPFVNLFDNSIESIETQGDETRIKFKNKEDVIVAKSFIEAQNYISSGTIKGVELLGFLVHIMKTGGYLVIDEIENHLHKKLVQTIIGLFDDPTINKKGATLLFSTHYSEIMDCLERKDNIYVLVRNNSHESRAVRYSDVVSRNDIKKSEVLLSNYIEGTAPSYESVRFIKELLCKLQN